MKKTRLVALSFAMVMAGAAVAPVATYAAPGIAIPPVVAPIEGWEEFESNIREMVAPYVKLYALEALYNEVQEMKIDYKIYVDVAKVMDSTKQLIDEAKEGLVGENDESLTEAYVELSKVMTMYDFRPNFDLSGVPMIVDYDALFESAKASIAGLDKVEALRAAVNAVDEQIPNWNIWKYVPYAMEQVQYGRVCLSANGVAVQCRKSGYTAQFMIIRALVPDVDENGNYIEGWEQLPEVVHLESMSLPALVTYAERQPLYESDVQFAELVDATQQNYDDGFDGLKEAIKALTDVNTNNMTIEQAIATLEGLPEAEAYGISSTWEDDEDGLYWRYADAYSYLEFAATDDDILSNAYANLVVAAAKVDPEFSVNLGTVPVVAPAVPTAPNTGSEGFELAGTLAKVAVTGVAGLAAIAGTVVTVKRYAFSPLKRK